MAIFMHNIILFLSRRYRPLGQTTPPTGKEREITAKIRTVVALTLLITGCQGLNPPPHPSISPLEDEVTLQKFEKASKHLKKKNYTQASQLFESLIEDGLSPQMNLFALYNAGSAYEGLKKCLKASIYFKKVVHLPTNKIHQIPPDKITTIKAQAQLRLSYTYECLGKDKEVIKTLTKLRKEGAKWLPKEVGLSEIPSRIGGAYIRRGQTQKANQFFKIAEEGLLRLRDNKQDIYRQNELLAKTLFLMGNTQRDVLSLTNVDRYLASLRYQQIYLLRSADIGSKEWSKESTSQLLQIYDNLWELITTRVPHNTNKSDLLRQKIKMARTTLNNLLDIRSQRIQDNQESTGVSQLFKILEEHEKNFSYFLKKYDTPSSEALLQERDPPAEDKPFQKDKKKRGAK